MIHLTRVEARSGKLCKRLELGADGLPHTDGTGGAMARGTATRVILNGSPATNFCELIQDLGPHEALVLGDFADGLPDKVKLVKAELANPAKGTYGRTRQTFQYRPGQPALALLDYDQKQMPDDVRQRLVEVGGLEGALATLIPDYAELARVIVASSSAGLYHRQTGEEYPGSGGLHNYLFAQDGADIGRFLKTLHKRMWFAGYGWVMVGARGQMLIRSIIDTAVGSPERLVFEARPLVIPPLAQDLAKRVPVAHEGALIDTLAACPPLTAAEERRFDELVAAAERAAKPQAEAAIETAATAIAQDRGIDLAAARTVIASSLKGELTSHDMLQFSDGTVASVADVLADPERFHDQTLADPVEGVGYGRNKAQLYANVDGVIIHSFAHGRTVYRLRHDAAYIEAQLTAAGNGAPFVLAGLMPHTSDMDPVTSERLRNLAAKLGNVSKATVKKQIEADTGKVRRNAIEAAKARRAAEQAEADAGAGSGANAHEDDPESELEAAIAELNETYFVASLGGTVRIVRQVLGRERLVFLTEQGFKLKFGNRYVNKVPLGEAWLSDPRRRTYDRIELIPSGPCPPDVFNLWRGFGVEPKAGDWLTIEQHLWSVICDCNQQNYDWLLGWLAYCVQYPGRQAEVAVVMRGLKGTGKGMVGQMLMRIFSNHALHITHSKHLVGNFNAHLLDALFLFLDEAFWAGDKQGEGTLKALITELTVVIEPKGVDLFQVVNRLKILMASNSDWVVPATADERRYFVLDVTDKRKGDRAYFTALAAAINGDELAAFLDYLLQLDLTEFDHRNPPHTSGLNQQKLISGDSVQKFWHDCLWAGEIVGTGLTGWPQAVVVQLLHAAYQDHARAHGDRYPMIDARMAEGLRDLMPEQKLARYRPRAGPFTSGQSRPPSYRLPSLEAARTAFLAFMKIPPETYPWPTVAEEGE